MSLSLKQASSPMVSNIPTDPFHALFTCALIGAGGIRDAKIGVNQFNQLKIDTLEEATSSLIPFFNANAIPIWVQKTCQAATRTWEGQSRKDIEILKKSLMQVKKAYPLDSKDNEQNKTMRSFFENVSKGILVLKETYDEEKETYNKVLNELFEINKTITNILTLKEEDEADEKFKDKIKEILKKAKNEMEEISTSESEGNLKFMKKVRRAIKDIIKNDGLPDRSIDYLKEVWSIEEIKSNVAQLNTLKELNKKIKISSIALFQGYLNEKTDQYLEIWKLKNQDNV